MIGQKRQITSAIRDQSDKTAKTVNYVQNMHSFTSLEKHWLVIDSYKAYLISSKRDIPAKVVNNWHRRQIRPA